MILPRKSCTLYKATILAKRKPNDRADDSDNSEASEDAWLTLTKSDTDVDAPGLPGSAADPEAFYEARVPEATTIKTRQRLLIWYRRRTSEPCSSGGAMLSMRRLRLCEFSSVSQFFLNVLERRLTKMQLAVHINKTTYYFINVSMYELLPQNIYT